MLTRRSPVEFVLTAVVSTLKAHAGLTALVSSTGIYNHVEQGTSFPYVVVTSPADRRVDTAGQFGAETLVNVQVVSQYKGDQEASRVMSQCVSALNFTALATTQHETFGSAWDNTERYSETINGVQTRYHVGIFRVWTGQSST